ncbi:phosphopantetheine-binding protein [Vibrio sp. ZSDZ34]|jgi:acyl carrier protein|uniref:Phosphopantetheine-binding protein n=1 Tax=Vibrio gelatinilyticus TaxID=2893468 RepID=A0A9X1WC56_9VIBR|nr:phosphopantetheine-binding protein [Vibrio gelatinilyticus]MCJ2377569.1 phosphopantetheine-binding protein [Vibrio gelatinilyticus]
MDREQLHKLVISQLIDIAPELDGEVLTEDEDMRDAFDLDSMDFLNLVTAVSKQTGINIPEVDYPKVLTIDNMLGYLLNR